MASVQGSKTTIIAASAASWHPATSGTSPGKDDHLPPVLGGRKAAGHHTPSPVCNLSCMKKPRGGRRTLGRLACKLSERMPQLLLAGQGQGGFVDPDSG